MKIVTLESFPPNANPYQADAYHMGITLGTNVIVMIKNHDNEHCPYLIIVNKKTGERFRVDIE